MSTVAILGSAYAEHGLLGEPVEIPTDLGSVRLYRIHPHAYVLYRHGLPHRNLPNQIPYRAHALALKFVGCQSLLVTTSAGVLNPELPLFQPLAIGDVLMPDNRLPDGSACTMFAKEQTDQGHLVLEEGLVDSELTAQVAAIAESLGTPLFSEVLFAYTMGPRTKTRAENAYWRSLGAQINSMTTAPELVLANELEIPCTAVAIGHKYSYPGASSLGEDEVRESLESARKAMNDLVDGFLEQARPVAFKNTVYRFGNVD